MKLLIDGSDKPLEVNTVDILIGDKRFHLLAYNTQDASGLIIHKVGADLIVRPITSSQAAIE